MHADQGPGMGNGGMNAKADMIRPPAARSAGLDASVACSRDRQSTGRRRRGAALAALLPIGALALHPAPAAAQARREITCSGQRVSRLEVITSGARIQRDTLDWWDAPENALRRTLRTTRAPVVADLMLLQPGDRCDEFTRAESERVLRAHPFIGDARVRSYDDGQGGVVLTVRTRDEFLPILKASFSSEAPWVDAVTVGDGNILGTGVLVAAGAERFERRTGGEFRFHDYTVLGRPWQLVLDGRVGDVGERRFGGDFLRPLLTDAQRVTWRVSVVDEQAVFGWQEPDRDSSSSIGTITRFGYLGALVRVGSIRRPLRVGLAWSREASGTRPSPLDNGVPTNDPRVNRFRDNDFSRVNVISVLRLLRFARVPGFQTLRASEDIRLGLELDGTFGLGVPALGADATDLYASLSGDYGIGGPRTFLAVRAGQQARRLVEDGEWEDVFTSANARLFHRLNDRRVLRAELGVDATWQALRPVQLRLGRAREGVRGYEGSREAGARRMVLSLEEQRYLGTWRDRADLGLAVFSDVGKVWQGDDPFGATSPVKAGLGIGFVAAVPPGTRRTYRLDVAYPLVSDPNAGWEFRITVLGAGQLGARPLARDLRAGMPRTGGASRFEMPR